MEWEENSFVPQDEPQKGKKKTHLTILAGVLLAMALIGAGIFATPYLMPVEQMAGRFTYELGQTVSREIEDYVIGRSWATDKCALDLTQVREYEVGEYPVTVRHGFQRFDYVIRIQDTIAPVLTLQGGPYVLEVEEDYGVDFFDIEAKDNATQISWGIADADATGDLGDAHLYGEVLSYDTIGYHRVAVSAEDTSGNISWIELDVLVDDGPEINGVRDFYLAVGARADYFEGITSMDAVDGDLTQTLSVDISEVNADTPGVYEIAYENKDQFGFSTRIQAKVHVMDSQELQEAINTHVLNRREHRIIGALNLYDSGCYEADNVQFIVNQMEPAVVGIGISEVSWGSGFIMEIGQRDMIICTNQHVVKDYRDVGVYFHDGTSVKGQIKASDYDLDMAFITVPVSAIPQEVLDTLMTVHINKSYWETLDDEADINLCMRTINRDGSIWRDRMGKLVSKDGQLPEGVRYRGVDPITEVDLKLYSGCSGSAILDGHGNLIAMAAGHSDDRYYAIPLGNILDYFKKVFGREVYYE